MTLYLLQGNSIKENLGAELFFILVKDNDHYCGGTEKGLAFLQTEVAWVPYSFIGYLHKQVPVTGGGMYVRLQTLYIYRLILQ